MQKRPPLAAYNMGGQIHILDVTFRGGAGWRSPKRQEENPTTPERVPSKTKKSTRFGGACCGFLQDDHTTDAATLKSGTSG